jgi:hypothetical protein
MLNCVTLKRILEPPLANTKCLPSLNTEDKVVPVYVIKTYRGSTVKPPLIPNQAKVNGQNHTPVASSQLSIE